MVNNITFTIIIHNQELVAALHNTVKAQQLKWNWNQALAGRWTFQTLTAESGRPSSSEVRAKRVSIISPKSSLQAKQSSENTWYEQRCSLLWGGGGGGGGVFLAIWRCYGHESLIKLGKNIFILNSSINGIIFSFIQVEIVLIFLY